MLVLKTVTDDEYCHYRSFMFAVLRICNSEVDSKLLQKYMIDHSAKIMPYFWVFMLTS